MKTIDEAGILAIATRLQRLSENLRKDGTLIYKAYGIDFEPKYFPVVFVLHYKPLLSIVQVAEEIGYSHPSTISLLKDLEQKGLVESRKHENDDRRRMVRLTAKGNALVKKIQPIWQVMNRALSELLATKHNLLTALTEVEQRLEEQGFYQRAKKEIIV
ncbi:MAG TPA: MarR family winged helix-turn-helix transcriptional regulator [Puia sp.]|jgi:DNA-binding MarR family transcriptional regulator|nr:MarR family winged helix-turn-helix transcriptional regulator [Puia sp.]